MDNSVSTIRAGPSATDRTGLLRRELPTVAGRKGREPRLWIDRISPGWIKQGCGASVGTGRPGQVPTDYVVTDQPFLPS